MRAPRYRVRLGAGWLLAVILLFPARPGAHTLLQPAVAAAAAPPAPPSTIKLSSIYPEVAAWREAFKADPAAACAADKPDSLCAAVAATAAAGSKRRAKLVLAASPVAFSAADPASTGGLFLVPPPRDQRPCRGGAAFAAAAAAQTAMAAALRVDARSLEPLSVYDLLYCGRDPPADSCQSEAALKPVLAQLTRRRVASEACLPYAPAAGGGRTLAGSGGLEATCGTCWNHTANATSDVAKQHHKQAGQGSFSYRALPDELSVVEFVRDGGGVVSRFDLYSDFEPFFKDPKNAGAVYRPSPTAKLLEPHAVAIVGYNLREGYWLALNSWGPDFGDYGLFKVAFGAANIAKGPDLYGVTWLPGYLEGRSAPFVPRGKACFDYLAVDGDTLAGIAARYRAPLQRLLSENAATIEDLDAPLAAKTLRICGATPTLDVLAADAQAAIDAGTFGVVFNGGGYKGIYYHSGVLSVLAAAGLAGPRTKMTASAQATQCLLCSKWTIGDHFQYVDDVRHTCAKIVNCVGILEATFRQELEYRRPPPGAAERCYGVCFIGLSAQEPTDSWKKGQYFEVTDFRSQEDWQDALIASMFFPIISSAPFLKTAPLAASYRNQPVTSGLMAADRLPPPPGLTYAMRVFSWPAPVVVASSDMYIKLGLSAYAKVMRSVTLDDIFGEGNGTKAANAALAYEATDEELRAAAEQAFKLGADIAPNIFTPLPIVDVVSWWSANSITLTDDTAAFMFKLGQKDAAAWVQALGLKGMKGAVPASQLATTPDSGETGIRLQVQSPVEIEQVILSLHHGH